MLRKRSIHIAQVVWGRTRNRRSIDRVCIRLEYEAVGLYDQRIAPTVGRHAGRLGSVYVEVEFPCSSLGMMGGFEESSEATGLGGVVGVRLTEGINDLSES